jgi:hypothetical protein
MLNEKKEESHAVNYFLVVQYVTVLVFETFHKKNRSWRREKLGNLGVKYCLQSSLDTAGKPPPTGLPSEALSAVNLHRATFRPLSEHHRFITLLSSFLFLSVSPEFLKVRFWF